MATGERYRWISEGGQGRTRTTAETAAAGQTGRYEGLSVTLYGKGEAVAVSSSAGSRGGTAYLGKDIQGSTRSVTGGTGQLEDRYEYDAFGTPYKGGFDSGMNRGYTGKPYDSVTGLYDYGYRDYAPAAARFTTVDPIRDGNNWFAYVHNNPVSYIDLWGLLDWDLLGKGIYNTVVGVGKVTGGVALTEISVAGSVATSGTLSPLGAIGVIVGVGAVANGWVQASVGVAEVLGGLTTDPQPNRPEIPNTLNQVIGVVGDDIISYATGENSTVMRDGAKVIDEIQSTVTTKGLGLALSLAVTNIKLH
jgi:RHS repeat-associated protein